ncbi:UNVERIFIED_CONTAM: Retrovirus-related Pol polyprotein from transposon TNT 1-94 [Sesamum radiatum]|uniref:Retrovirus-related Pol polyprotein from transposon TNT 1-94 n=1 Tax=Sesamum radiatum TaxID=300843 RepID=A0AAW2KLF9_SESRA
MAFLNGFIEEEIYMYQQEGFTVVREEVCHLQRSIYDLKQASRSWNMCFDEVIRGYNFIKNEFDPCVYKKISGCSIAFLVLYVDNILLIGNDVKMLGDTKVWLSTQFSMKDLGFLPIRHGVKLSKKQSPKTDEELKKMLNVPYASVIGSIQYVAQCTRTDVAYALSVTSRYQACAGEAHWTVVKTILKMAWKSSKQDTTTDSTMEVEYIAASEPAKEAVWMKNYIQELGVVPSIVEPVVIFCDNNGAIAQAKELRSHHRSKYIIRRYLLLREMVGRGDIRMDRGNSVENTVDLRTKPLSQIAHAQHLRKMDLKQ